MECNGTDRSPASAVQSWGKQPAPRQWPDPRLTCSLPRPQGRSSVAVCCCRDRAGWTEFPDAPELEPRKLSSEALDLARGFRPRAAAVISSPIHLDAAGLGLGGRSHVKLPAAVTEAEPGEKPAGHCPLARKPIARMERRPQAGLPPAPCPSPAPIQQVTSCVSLSSTFQAVCPLCGAKHTRSSRHSTCAATGTRHTQPFAATGGCCHTQGRDGQGM